MGKVHLFVFAVLLVALSVTGTGSHQPPGADRQLGDRIAVLEQRHAAGDIAFRARLDVDFSSSSTATVPYNVTELNVGGGYNDTTYTFTAPVTGTYFLYAVNVVDSYEYNRVILRHNDVMVTWCQLYPYYDVASMTCNAVVYMEAGDVADVAVEGNYGVILGAYRPYPDCQFGGFIVGQMT